jgi:hypothetical protein
MRKVAILSYSISDTFMGDTISAIVNDRVIEAANVMAFQFNNFGKSRLHN